MLQRLHIRRDERGLRFVNQEFIDVLAPGKHWIVSLPFHRQHIDVVCLRDTWLSHLREEEILDSALLGDDLLREINLTDHQRGLVWVNERFETVLGPGRYGLWTAYKKSVRVEIVDAREARFEHPELDTITRSATGKVALDVIKVETGQVAVAFHKGVYQDTLPPGIYATWKGGYVDFIHVDLREQVLDVTGQEIMTADKVTLRLNAVLTYRITDPVKMIETVRDASGSLYRETQLVLRTEVGLRNLDTLLGERDAVAAASADVLRGRASEFGIELRSLGIRDLILPGEMRTLLNQVIEARKAAEANVIKRREETAALRSQVNSAKLYEDHPTLLRLRELESLETVAETAEFQVFLGSESLTDKVTKLI